MQCIPVYEIPQREKCKILERHANLKYYFESEIFWATGYYVSIVEINALTIKNISDRRKIKIKLERVCVRRNFYPLSRWK